MFICRCPRGVMRQGWNDPSSFPSAWEKTCSRAAFLELSPPTLKKGFSYQWAYPNFPDRLRKQRGLSALRCCAWDETKENQAFGFCPGFSGFLCASPRSQGLPLLSTSEPLDLAPSDLRGPVSLTSAKFLVWYTLLRLPALASVGARVLIFYLFCWSYCLYSQLKRAGYTSWYGNREEEKKC